MKREDPNWFVLVFIQKISYRSKQRGISGRDRERHDKPHRGRSGAGAKLHVLYSGLHADGRQPHVGAGHAAHAGGR